MTISEPPKDPTGTKKPSQINALTTLLAVAVIVFVSLCGLLLAHAKFQSKNGQSLDKSAQAVMPPGNGPAELAVGAQVPDFVVRSFGEGKNDWLKLSQISGKVTLVNFWATWCEACVQEMPSIVQLRKSYHSKGFDVVAIDLDDEPDKTVPRALKALNIDFPVFTDPEGKVSELFDVHAIPMTVIVDAQRRILMYENSEFDWDSDEMHAKLQGWLGG